MGQLCHDHIEWQDRLYCAQSPCPNISDSSAANLLLMLDSKMIYQQFQLKPRAINLAKWQSLYYKSEENLKERASRTQNCLILCIANIKYPFTLIPFVSMWTVSFNTWSFKRSSGYFLNIGRIFASTIQEQQGGSAADL